MNFLDSFARDAKYNDLAKKNSKLKRNHHAEAALFNLKHTLSLGHFLLVMLINTQLSLNADTLY